jgi:RNA polymerase sigma-70 factor (ECF subfamily)
MPDVLDDENLLAQVRDRQDHQAEAAFQTLYRRYAGAVYSLVRRLLRDQRDIEETVQDVFVRVWQRAGEFQSVRGSASSWILTIAHHAAIDLLRRNTVRATVPTDDAELEQRAITPDQSVETVERVVIARAMNRLDDTERTLIELAYFEGLSHGQLAERTGMPLGTIKTRIRQALVKLRTELGVG